MRKPKKEKKKREKNKSEALIDFKPVEFNIDDEPTEDEKEEWKKELLNVPKCSIRGCDKKPMSSTGMCPDCYQDMSNEMAKTVRREDSEPWKLNGSYKRLQNLIDGE